MNPISVILQVISGLTGLGNATTRLVQAAKASEPPATGPTPDVTPDPPKPLGYSGAPLAQAYLRGANDEAWRLQERDRMTADAKRLGGLTAQRDDDGPAEQPVDGEGKP